LNLYWKQVYTTDTTISFAISCKCNGWYSVAWSPTGQMLDSDAVIGSVSNPTQKVMSVASYKLPEDAAPEPNSSSLKLHDVSTVSSNGLQIMFFTRDILSGVNPLNISQHVIGAYHPDSTALVYHETYHSTQDIVQNFLSGEKAQVTSNPFTLREVHGMLMIMGWFFLALGAFVARYGRWIPPGDVWFHAHRIIQYLGFGISMAGFVVAFCMNTTHFKTVYHAQLGVTITTLCVLQVLSAFFRPHPPSKTNPEKTSVRVAFELFHWWNGRILLVLAAVQLYSGIVLIGWTASVVPYAVCIGIIVLAVIVGEIVTRYYPMSKVVSCFENCLCCRSSKGFASMTRM